MSHLMPYGKDSTGLTKFADANDSLVNFGQVFEFLPISDLGAGG